MRPVKRLWNRVQQQIFVWAGDKPLQLKYSGFVFYVPPRNQTAKKGPGSIYVFESAKDGHGRTIPGTIVAQDLLQTTPEGGYTKTFDVDAACRFFDRDKPKLFEQGFQIVSEIGDIDTAMADCVPLWEEAEDERAHKILQAELERQETWKKKGQEPPKSSSAAQVEWAVKHLARPGRRGDKPAFDTDQLKDVLAGKVDDVPVPPEPVHVPEEAHPVPRGEVAANMRLYDEAKELGVKLTRTELAALLENDTEIVQLVAEKVEVKRQEAAEPAAS